MFDGHQREAYMHTCLLSLDNHTYMWAKGGGKGKAPTLKDVYPYDLPEIKDESVKKDAGVPPPKGTPLRNIKQLKVFLKHGTSRRRPRR